MAVVLVDVFGGNLDMPLCVCARFGHVLEQGISALHLLYCPVERFYCLVYVVDNFVYHEVGQLVVAYELNLFGVDKDKAELFGAVLIQKTDKERA